MKKQKKCGICGEPLEMKQPLFARPRLMPAPPGHVHNPAIVHDHFQCVNGHDVFSNRRGFERCPKRGCQWNKDHGL
jgi:hypothetical protein